MKNKNFIVIIMVIAVIVIGLGVLAFFLFNKKEDDKQVSTEWGQKYYLYLSDDENKNDIKDEAQDAKINFYEVKDIQDPVMVLSYKVDEKKYSNVYYIKEDKVNTIIYNEPSNIEFLYNTSSDSYDYYYHFENTKKDYYNDLSKVIVSMDNTSEQQKADYEFEKKTPIKVNNKKKETLSFTDFEKIFILVNDGNNGIEYSTNYDSKELKDMIENSIEIYTPQESLITDEVKAMVIERHNKIKEYIELINEKNEKEDIDKLLSKLKGIWYEKKNMNCFEVYKSGKSYYLNMGWFGSEYYLMGEIKSVKKKANNKYTFTIKDTISKKNIEVDFNTSNIGKKKVSANGTTYTYVASNWDDAYKKVL